MKPIEFPECNATYAESQMEYQKLPAYKSGKDDEEVITCWKLSWKERLHVLVFGKFWLRQLSFGSPLQPQLPEVVCPFTRDKK